MRRAFEWWMTWPRAIRWIAGVWAAIVLSSLVIGPFLATRSDDLPSDLPATRSSSLEVEQAGEVATSTSGRSTTTGLEEPEPDFPEGSAASNESATTLTSMATETTGRSVDYIVQSVQDVSFPGATRTVLRVTVEAGATRSDLRRIASTLTGLYREVTGYQALMISFYYYPELIDDYAPLGVWFDAPFGDWGAADQVEPGDYSAFEIEDNIREKDWSLLPSEAQVALYVGFLTQQDAMWGDGTNLPTEEDIAQALAATLAISPEEILEALEAVVEWQLG